jgi:signal transduction histidine kinase
MSSKISPQIFKSSSFHLSLWYAGLFIASSFLTLIATYFFLASILRAVDQQAIVSELKELASEYNSYGVSDFQQEVAGNLQYRKKNPFFIRLTDWTNRTLQVVNHELWDEFDLNLLEKEALRESWIYFPARHDDYDLMLASVQLQDGRWLQLGRSSETRQKTLERFSEVFVIIALPLAFFAFAGGTYLAARTLRPIRHIIQTVQSIRTGDMEARVPQSGVGDELDELARLFNEMLDRINALIIGMKDALDNVAHDLRTPMTRLQNIAETALRVGQDGNLCREALTDCLEESDRVLHMLATLMDIAEAESGGMHLHQSVINLSPLLSRIMDMYQYVAEEKEVQMSLSLPQVLNAAIDRDRMSQAIANILDNAIKYTPSGGQITLEAYQIADTCVIKVKDTGIGIPQTDLPKIWDRLYRGDASRSTKGLGLGLSFVKAIVNAHKGDVSASSPPGQGSCLTIVLPLKH